MNKVFHLFLLSLLSMPICIAADYTIDDLKVLQKDGNIDEYLTHALDIRPSLRNSWWTSTTESMLQKKLKNETNYSVNDRDSFKKFFLVKELKESEAVQSAWITYSQNYFNWCYQSKNPTCNDELLEYFEFIKNNVMAPDIAMNILSTIDKYRLPIAKTQFVTFIATGPTAQFNCNKDNVKAVVFDELKSLYTTSAKPKDFINNLSTVASDDCIKHLVNDLQKYLQTLDSDYGEVSYHLLKHLKLLDQITGDVFLISYIMNNPVVGETFNEAWNKLEELGKNYDERMKVLNYFKHQKFLPDELINSPNVEKRNVLLNKMTANFPEYLDYYARTCLSYLSGDKKYPYGNPTKHCRTLIKISKEVPNSWVEPSLLNRLNPLDN